MIASTSGRRGNPPSTPPRSARLRALVIFAIFLVAVVGAAVVGWRYAEASKPLTGPVILISIDTLRADRLPAYGRQGLATPSLDRLAAEGFVFERAYAHSPQSLVSHTSMLTGLLPFEHGVRDDVGFRLEERHTTLADWLRGRGFDTGAAVSSHLLRADSGIGRGFAAYDATLPPAGASALPPVVQRDGESTVAAALKWLAAQESSRFFYFLHLNEPHAPYAPPPRFAGGDAYDGEIAYADELLGRFLKGLQSKGLYDQALIIVTSDHGEGLGEHGELEHGLFLYEEDVHVPLIVKMPGSAKAHRVRELVQHIDLVPTVLDLVRAPIQGGLQGRSLRALLEGDEEATLTPRPVYAEALYGRFHFGWADVYSLTDDRYRFIDAPSRELYDLDADPSERNNVVASEAGRADALKEQLVPLQSGTIGQPEPVPPSERPMFAAFGYSANRPMLTAASEDVRRDPKDGVSIVDAFRRGTKLGAASQFAEAIAVLQAAAVARPGIAELWYELGHLELRDGRAEDAIASFGQFASLRPDSPRGPRSMAEALLALGRGEDAVAQVALALELTPAADREQHAGITDIGIRAALSRDDAITARRLAAEAQAAHPSLALGPYVEGRLLHAHGDFAGALPLLEDALAVSVERAVPMGEINWYLGDTLLRLDRYEEAEDAFRRELELWPQNIRAYASLATLYRASHRDRAADDTVEALARAVPTAEGRKLAARLRSLAGEKPTAAKF